MNLAILTKLAINEEAAGTGEIYLNKLDAAIMAKADKFKEIEIKAELINRQIEELYKMQSALNVQKKAIEIEVIQAREILKKG